MTTNKPLKEYMTILEASKILGITEEYVRRLCTNGKIKGAIKFGRTWAIPRADVMPIQVGFHDFLERKKAINDNRKLPTRYDDYTAGEILKEI